MITVMSNYDHQIDKEAEIVLRANPGGQMCYTAWNFHGTVSWNNDKQQFICEVWIHGSLRETVERNSMEEIMEHCCTIYGRD